MLKSDSIEKKKGKAIKPHIFHIMTDDGHTIKIRPDTECNKMQQDKQSQKRKPPVTSSLPATQVNIVNFGISGQDNTKTLTHAQANSNKNIVVVPQNQCQQQGIVLGQTVFQSSDGKKFILVPSSSENKKLPIQPIQKSTIINPSPKAVLPIGGTCQSTLQPNANNKGFVYMPTGMNSGQAHGITNSENVTTLALAGQTFQGVSASSLNTVSQASLIKIGPGNAHTAQLIQLPLNMVQASNILTNMAQGSSPNVNITEVATSHIVCQSQRIPELRLATNSLTTTPSIENKLTIKDIVQAITDRTNSPMTSVITSNHSCIARPLFPKTTSQSAETFTQSEINVAETLLNAVKVPSLSSSSNLISSSQYLSNKAAQEAQSILRNNASFTTPTKALTTYAIHERQYDNPGSFSNVLNQTNYFVPTSITPNTLSTLPKNDNSTVIVNHSKEVRPLSMMPVNPHLYSILSQHTNTSVPQNNTQAFGNNDSNITVPNIHVSFANDPKDIQMPRTLLTTTKNLSFQTKSSFSAEPQCLPYPNRQTDIKMEYITPTNFSRQENPAKTISAISAILGLVKGTGISTPNKTTDPNMEPLLPKLCESSNSIGSCESPVSQCGSKTNVTISSCESRNYHSSQASNNPSADKISNNMMINVTGVIEPQKKDKKKTKRLSKGSSGKANHGRRLGPPFSANRAPPLPFTPASATCTMFEHTLLKIATRGFWGCEMGVLQDVFRTIRCEPNQTVSLDHTDTVEDVTHRCYDYVKQKLLDCSDQKEKLYRYMRNYVKEFDSYLDRVHPVAVIALIIYFPNAYDYIDVCWHGIPPTGWSEYRRAVVMREVFDVLYKFGKEFGRYPEYDRKFFENPKRSTYLKPRTFDVRQSWDETDCPMAKTNSRYCPPQASTESYIAHPMTTVNIKQEMDIDDTGSQSLLYVNSADRNRKCPLPNRTVIRFVNSPSGSLISENAERTECYSSPPLDSKFHSGSSEFCQEEDSDTPKPGNKIDLKNTTMQDVLNSDTDNEEMNNGGDLKIDIPENGDVNIAPKRSRNFHLENLAEMALRDSGRYNEDCPPEGRYSEDCPPEHNEFSATSLTSYSEFCNESKHKLPLNIDTDLTNKCDNTPKVLSPSVISAQWAESIAAACGNRKVWKKEQFTGVKSETTSASKTSNVDRTDRLSFLVEAACQQASVSSNQSEIELNPLPKQHSAGSLSIDIQQPMDFRILDIQHSLAFEALLTDRAPPEPFVILHDGTDLRLGEYFETYPLENHCPSENAVLVVEGERYKLKEVLGYMRRGVQLVEYIDSNPVVDTTRTIKKDALIVAVRKVPPGKISKMIHPDLHLENYSLHLLPVGVKQPQKAKKGKAIKKKRKFDEMIEEKGKETDDNCSIGSPLIGAEEVFSPASRFCESEESCLSPPAKQCKTNMPVLEFQELDQIVVKTQQTQTEAELTGLNDRPSITQTSIEDALSTAIQAIISQQLTEERDGNATKLEIIIESYKRAANFLLDTAKCLENLR